MSDEVNAYLSSIYPKHREDGIDKQIRLFIARSTWPRILLARSRLLLYTSLQLVPDLHWELLKALLSYTRQILHYTGIYMHALRLLLHMKELNEANDLRQHLAHAWFEIGYDIHWIISTYTPVGHLASFSFLLIELDLIAMRGCIEIKEFASFNKKFSQDNTDETKPLAAHSRAMLEHAYKKFALNLGVILTRTFLFVVRYFVLPSAYNPFIHFLFAALALAISLVNHSLSHFINSTKPKCTNFFKAHGAHNLNLDFDHSAPLEGSISAV